MRAAAGEMRHPDKRHVMMANRAEAPTGGERIERSSH